MARELSMRLGAPPWCMILYKVIDYSMIQKLEKTQNLKDKLTKYAWIGCYTPKFHV